MGRLILGPQTQRPSPGRRQRLFQRAFLTNDENTETPCDERSTTASEQVAIGIPHFMVVAFDEFACVSHGPTDCLALSRDQATGGGTPTLRRISMSRHRR